MTRDERLRALALVEKWRVQAGCEMYGCCKVTDYKHANELEAFIAEATTPPVPTALETGSVSIIAWAIGGEQSEASDPEQAARERLGKWLTARGGRAWTRGQECHGAKRWLVQLWEDCEDLAGESGWCSTSADAISAALDAAERKADK